MAFFNNSPSAEQNKSAELCVLLFHHGEPVMSVVAEIS